MSLYTNLCGITAAVFSDNYPFFKVPLNPAPLRSLGRLINCMAVYLLVSKVAEFALSVIESLVFTKIESQTGQVFLFIASVGFVFFMPRIEQTVKSIMFGHSRRSDFRGED